MKKYNVYDLSVIKVEKNGVTYRFICKKSIFNDSCYAEVLTGDNVIAKSNDDITPLYSYYSPIATHDMTTGKPLMLDKMDILKKYIDINKDVILEREAATYENNNLLNVEEILDRAVSDLFPEKGNWGSDCFNRPDTVGIPYIPCHARDDEWMAKLIRKVKDIYFINLNRIIQYLKESDFYKEKRHNYELEVVRWQIEWMMSGGENWLVEDSFGGDFIMFDESGDIGFRRGIYRTLTKIGMNPEVVEEGIEKNAAMWRDSWMNKAFRNRFEPIFGEIVYPLFHGQETAHTVKQLPPASDELRNLWLKLRKYEYYLENKSSVDKYGDADDDMLMSEEDAEELRKEVRRLSIERQREISEFRKARNEEIQGHGQYKKKK